MQRWTLSVASVVAYSKCRCSLPQFLSSTKPAIAKSIDRASAIHEAIWTGEPGALNHTPVVQRHEPEDPLECDEPARTLPPQVDNRITPTKTGEYERSRKKYEDRVRRPRAAPTPRRADRFAALRR
jgi:hypothetical protein